MEGVGQKSSAAMALQSEWGLGALAFSIWVKCKNCAGSSESENG